MGSVGGVGGLGGVDGEGVIGALGAVGVDTGVSVAAGGVASLVGNDVTGAFGLQPRSSAGIRISATKILRFILPPHPDRGFV